MPAARKIRHLVLILTSRCNLHCTYCYQTARKVLSMDWQTARASIDLARSLAGRGFSLLFTGGEPLLEWPLLLRAAEYAAPGCGKLEICTNGLLLSDAVLESLDRLGFHLHLSFDGVAAAQDARSEGTFAALDHTLVRLRRQTPDLFRRRLRISALQTPATLSALAASVAYFLAAGVREIALSPPLRPSATCEPGLLHELDAQFREVYQHSLRHLEQTGEVPVALLRNPPGGDGSGHETCSAARGEVLTVDADGQACGCPLFAESYQDPSGILPAQALASLRMGSIHDPGFADRHAAYVEAAGRSVLFQAGAGRYSSLGRCSECPCRNSCRICPAASVDRGAEQGDPRRVPDFVCAYYRTALRYRQMLPPPSDICGILSHSRFGVLCLDRTGTHPELPSQ